MKKMNKEMSTAFGCLMSLTIDIQDIIDRLNKYGIKSYNEINDENEVYKYLVYDERTKKELYKMPFEENKPMYRYEIILTFQCGQPIYMNESFSKFPFDVDISLTKTDKENLLENIRIDIYIGDYYMSITADGCVMEDGVIERIEDN